MKLAQVRAHGVVMNKSIIVLMMFIGVMGCGDSTETHPAGVWVTEYAEVFCDSAAPCYESFSVPGCISGFYDAACSGGGCQEDLTFNLGEWGECLDGITRLTCPELDAGVVPRECLAIDEFN